MICVMLAMMLTFIRHFTYVKNVPKCLYVLSHFLIMTLGSFNPHFTDEEMEMQVK